MLDMRLRLHARLIDEIDLSKLDKLDESEMRKQVRRLVGDFARTERLALNAGELDELGASVFDEMVGLGPIEPLLKDDFIADILINGPFQVYVERRGELETTPVRFRDNDHLLRIVNRIVATVGRRIDEILAHGRRPPARRQPGERGHLADRHRRCRRSRSGSSPRSRYDLERLVGRRRHARRVAEFLYGAVRSRVSTVISGGTGSGKTTLLNALSAAIRHEERADHHRGRRRAAAAAAARGAPGNPARRTSKARARSASASWSRTPCGCVPTGSSWARSAARRPSTCCRP